ncbi:dehydrodolichyl diphosphate synthase CPT3-like [Aristolochia californica]|uniref:dehydrodolichyl diphosphate synthase CPT3-like n=1 Tax=Aristolochia californica TaxID=171875 RepID=UPI0035DD1E50
MEADLAGTLSKFCGNIFDIFRRYLFLVLSFGPVPQHIAFIMDGNRRFAHYRNLKLGKGHQVGFLALVSVLQYCYEMGVKYVTVYAFSIENFRRKPEEVQYVMDLMVEKLEGFLKVGSFLKQYGIRVNFLGNWDLLSSPLRAAAEKVTAATASNTRGVLSICVAYTSTDEIVHAVQESCKEKLSEIQEKSSEQIVIALADLERHMYMARCPDPDILVRTSGETRLSNFLLWQTTFCFLFAPDFLWPENTLKYLVWTILEYQRLYPYFRRQKQDHARNTLKFE